MNTISHTLSTAKPGVSTEIQPTPQPVPAARGPCAHLTSWPGTSFAKGDNGPLPLRDRKHYIIMMRLGEPWAPPGFSVGKRVSWVSLEYVGRNESDSESSTDKER